MNYEESTISELEQEEVHTMFEMAALWKADKELMLGRQTPVQPKVSKNSSFYLMEVL
jgi:hypothetical protein